MWKYEQKYAVSVKNLYFCIIFYFDFLKFFSYYTLPSSLTELYNSSKLNRTIIIVLTTGATAGATAGFIE